MHDEIPIRRFTIPRDTARAVERFLDHLHAVKAARGPAAAAAVCMKALTGQPAVKASLHDAYLSAYAQAGQPADTYGAAWNVAGGVYRRVDIGDDGTGRACTLVRNGQQITADGATVLHVADAKPLYGVLPRVALTTERGVKTILASTWEGLTK